MGIRGVGGGDMGRGQGGTRDSRDKGLNGAENVAVTLSGNIRIYLVSDTATIAKKVPI